CTFPLTSPECVSLIVTDIVVISVEQDGLVLLETAPGWEPREIQNETEPELILADDIKEIAL
ncbi:MAG: succinyl-CoA--3-ketoacid-CoA transferase, partial [Chloroflexota bacterium]|nr:succinyl-CoA--3-ketoacid-CoA transferase [Chloroflexota bacterium]